MHRLACVFAHPDDETFAVGGTLAKLAASGDRIDVFCATDGDAGKTSGIPVSSRAELGARRRAELTAASSVLGIGSLTTPGHPDGGLRDVDQDRLIGEIVLFLRRCRPEIVLTFGPEGAPTQHRDHRAISRASTAAFFLAPLPTEYTEQSREASPHGPARLYYCAWEPPDRGAELTALSVPVTCRIDVAPFLVKKREAFEAHSSQHQHRARFEQVAIREFECFALAAGVPQPRPITADLFEGL